MLNVGHCCHWSEHQERLLVFQRLFFLNGIDKLLVHYRSAELENGIEKMNRDLRVIRIATDRFDRKTQCWFEFNR